MGDVLGWSGATYVTAPWALAVVSGAPPLAAWAAFCVVFATRDWGPLFYPRAPAGEPVARPASPLPEVTEDVVIILNVGGGAAIGTCRPYGGGEAAGGGGDSADVSPQSDPPELHAAASPEPPVEA